MSELMNESETASLLGITKGTLGVWRCRRRHALPYVKIGRMVRYRRSDVEKWIASRTQSGAPAPRQQRGGAR
jgi:excisionase family DNA binding protein